MDERRRSFVFERVEKDKKRMLKSVTIGPAEILYGAVFHRFIVIKTVKSISQKFVPIARKSCDFEVKSSKIEPNLHT
jgi:hypothetical protein